MLALCKPAVQVAARAAISLYNVDFVTVPRGWFDVVATAKAWPT